MFEVSKTFRFEAGHELSFHDGKCVSPHGHSYAVTITVRSSTLVSSGPKQQMVLDFQEISHIVTPMIEEFFDHKYLNETLKTESPTAEFIAKWIYDYVKKRIPQLYKVSVSETEKTTAAYFEEK